MLTHFHLLPQLPFTTFETEVNYYHQKLNLQVPSLLAKLLKTYDLRNLGNFKKISKSAADIA